MTGHEFSQAMEKLDDIYLRERAIDVQDITARLLKCMSDDADAAEAKRLYGVEFTPMSEIKDCDAVVLAVAHDSYKALQMKDIEALYANNGKVKVLTDLKGILDKKAYEEAGYLYWRL